jgi:hypothetical protein
LQASGDDDGEEGDRLQNEERAKIHTELNGLMEMVLVPQPFTEEMMGGDVHLPIELSYSWPQCTVASFVELVATIAEASIVGQAILRNYFRQFWLDKNMHGFPGIRNRTLALAQECHLQMQRVYPTLVAPQVDVAQTLYKDSKG